MKKLTYKITTIFFILFCQLSLAGTTVDYQEILNKNFSGFVILSPSDIDFSYADMTQQEINKVRDTAHLLLANFNNDKTPDFVAKVRGLEKKIYPKSKHHPGYEYYSGGTVACISLLNRKYHCEFLWKTGTFTLPDHNYLVKIPKGTAMSCHHENYVDPYSGKTGVTSFILKTDAVGDLRMMGLGDSYFIPMPEGGFFKCTASD